MSNIHKNWKKFLKEETFVDDPENPLQSSPDQDAARRDEGRVIRSIISYLEELKQAQPAFDEVVRIAEQERTTWRGFDNPVVTAGYFRDTRERRLGKDTSPPGMHNSWPAHERLRTYWTNTGYLDGRGRIKGHDLNKHYSYENHPKSVSHEYWDNELGRLNEMPVEQFLGSGRRTQTPWSAAFISYVMTEAGESGRRYGFRNSGGHRTYKSRGNRTKNKFIELLISIVERLQVSSEMNYVLDRQAESDLKNLAYKYMSFDESEIGGYGVLLGGDLACKDVFHPKHAASTSYNIHPRYKGRLKREIQRDRVIRPIRTEPTPRHPNGQRPFETWQFSRAGFAHLQSAKRAFIAKKTQELSSLIDASVDQALRGIGRDGESIDIGLVTKAGFIEADKLDSLIIRKFINPNLKVDEWILQNTDMEFQEEMKILFSRGGQTDWLSNFAGEIEAWFAREAMAKRPSQEVYRRLRKYEKKFYEIVEKYAQSTTIGGKFVEGAHDGHCDICTSPTSAIGGNLSSTVKAINPTRLEQTYILTRNVEHKISYIKNIYSDVLAREDLSDVPK